MRTKQKICQYCNEVMPPYSCKCYGTLEFRKVSFDGFGINDTDIYASRIAKLQTDYLPFGPEMAKRWNAFEDLLKIAKAYRNVLRSTDASASFAFVDVVIAKAEGDL